ncbi:hypothetical protein MED297_04302 [Reinekea sp. MED297]|uniref:Uncharacterized protein n=2 Tax=Reinekea TaxID=230494 RepID=A4BG65_9GAMM|nr:hypothetical protein MED297_04302 [Reinekea sp. MED297] [Reinekea blandensis MED297]
MAGNHRKSQRAFLYKPPEGVTHSSRLTMGSAMFIDGLTDWEKRRLALTLKERGQTAFMVIKHAKAAVISSQRGREVHPIDQQNLDYLDEIIFELYGYYRVAGELRYRLAEESTNQGERIAY